MWRRTPAADGVAEGPRVSAKRASRSRVSFSTRSIAPGTQLATAWVFNLRPGSGLVCDEVGLRPGLGNDWTRSPPAQEHHAFLRSGLTSHSRCATTKPSRLNTRMLSVDQLYSFCASPFAALHAASERSIFKCAGRLLHVLRPR